MVSKTGWIGYSVVLILLGILLVLVAPGQPLNYLIQPHTNAHYIAGAINIILGLVGLYAVMKMKS